jgi:RHS repeat-associated protein
VLIKVETGELSSWENEGVEPKDWSGFDAKLTKTFSYDSHGRKIAERTIGTDDVTTEALTEYSYDDWDRVVCRAVRMNPASFGANSPNPCVPGTPGAFGGDRVTRYTYNDWDKVLTEERAVGTPRQQFYVTNTYAGPQLRSQKDANNNLTELEYDSNSRLWRRHYPSPTSPGTASTTDFNEYQYDPNGNVVYEKKRDNRTIAFEYDGNSRLVFKNLSDNSYSGDVAYDYDLRGLTLASCFAANKLEDDCDAGGSGETNVFDGFGSLASRTSRMAGTSRTLSYQYDLEGNRTRVTHPDTNFFAYGFDGLNRFNVLMENAAVGSPTPPLLTVAYRSGGGRLSINRTGGAVTSVELDNARRLDSFTQDLAGSANDLVNGFDYNPANQIMLLTQSNTLYTYAEFKNRVGSYTPNGLNQYTSIDESPLAYDANGNLTADAGTTFTYDMENHLVAVGGTVAGQGMNASLVYDVMGRLSQTTINGATTHFHYDGTALVGEYQGGVLTRRYVHGDQIDEPLLQYSTAVVNSSTRRFLHADHLGSLIAHSNGTGAAVQTNSYDAYGVPAVTNDGRFGYTGQTWLKELGLNYYKARIYSPKLGRFLQTDPIFYKSDFNLYAYVYNDSVNRMDPTGNEDVNVEEKRKSTSTLRRLWEKLNKAVWPKDPATGWNQDVSHKVAVADGGKPNDPTNLEPKPAAEHKAEHMRNGDFKRWGARAETAKAPATSPKPTGSAPGGSGKALGAFGYILMVPSIIDTFKESNEREAIGVPMSTGEFCLKASGMWDIAVESGTVQEVNPLDFIS